MRILSKHTATLLRAGTGGTDGGDYDEKGNWVDGTRNDGSSCKSDLPCLIQPAFRSGQSIKNLPEGVSSKDVKLLYTHVEIFATDEQTGITSDQIVWKGKTYEVFESDPWDGAGRIAAWEVVMIRKDGLKHDS
jgi:hypothetical protein